RNKTTESTISRRMRSPELFGGCERDAHWRRHVQALAGIGQTPALGIDAEYHDVIRLLIRSQQILARRIDNEIARRFSPSRHMLDRCKCVLGGIDREGTNVIRSAIRCVQKMARWIHSNLGRFVFSFEIRSQRRE